MKTEISFTLNSCHSVWSRSRQPDTETTRQASLSGWALLIVAILLLVVPLASHSGGKPNDNGNGGGTPVILDQVDFGDIFGDLIHIYRHEVTGQPIFAQRWVEMPADLPGYGWGYCAMVFSDYEMDTQKFLEGSDPPEQNPDYGSYILEDGERVLADSPVQIPFLPYSCELDPAFDDPDMVVEVDYFGRLNASRTMERNQRMHFNEVITNIQQAGALKLDAVGRLMLGYECSDYDCVWSTVDSPMESMALYTRLSKYGHFATDPTEEDLWWHGDPALYSDDEYPVHPWLTEDDFEKFFDAGLGHLLPDKECWESDGFDGFNKSCANPESLTPDDFNSSGTYLGAAADKTGWVSVDLIQYLNRFLRITQTTDISKATYDTLPAMYLDCYVGTPEDPAEDQVIVDDLVYDDVCELVSVDPDEGSTNPFSAYPNYEHFYNIQERFMDFEFSAYTRAIHLETAKAPLILQDWGLSSFTSYVGTEEVPLIEWVNIPNTLPLVNESDFDYDVNIANFVIGANDAARSIEYIHNYEIPEDLYCKYAPDDETLCYQVQ